MTANWALVLAAVFAMILSLAATALSVVSRLREQGGVVRARGDVGAERVANFIPIVEPTAVTDLANPDQGELFNDSGEPHQFLLPDMVDWRDDQIELVMPVSSRRHRREGELDDTVGYRATAACEIAGITFRQLDYWSRTSLVIPSMSGLDGERLYTFKDLLLLKIVKRLQDTGISLHNIRVAIDHLRERPLGDLSNITLFSDGESVYEAASAEEVVDLLTGGKGVFGIAVNGSMLELSSDVADVPGERVDGAQSTPSNVILIAHRRSQARKIG